MKRLPEKNADGLTPLELSEEQKFLFDTRGWLMIPGVLTENEIEEAREFCYRLQKDPASIPVEHRSSIGGPLIKLADRLHNMRTLDSMARDKQIKIASA